MKGHGMSHPAKWASRGLAVALVLAASGAFGATAAAPTHTDPGRDYSKENEFSFVPPEGWNKKSPPPKGLFVLYLAPNVQGGFATNVNVNVQSGGEGDLDQVIPQIKKALSGALKDYKAVDEGKITINGRPAVYLSGQFTGGGMALQNLQYGILGANKKVYTITFSTLESEFVRNRPIFEKCALTALTD